METIVFRLKGLACPECARNVGMILERQQGVKKAVVTFLFSLGNYLEARTMDKTRTALQKLMELAPRVSRVRRGEAEVEVPAEEVESGELATKKPSGTVRHPGRLDNTGGREKN